MTTMTITEMEPDHFGVQIEEGDVTTSHRVRVPGGFVDDLQLAEVDRERIVRETLAFLLERVPATQVPPELTVDGIGREYPEYYDELRGRLGQD